MRKSGCAAWQLPHKYIHQWKQRRTKASRKKKTKIVEWNLDQSIYLLSACVHAFVGAMTRHISSRLTWPILLVELIAFVDFFFLPTILHCSLDFAAGTQTQCTIVARRLVKEKEKKKNAWTRPYAAEIWARTQFVLSRRIVWFSISKIDISQSIQHAYDLRIRWTIARMTLLLCKLSRYYILIVTMIVIDDWILSTTVEADSWPSSHLDIVRSYE